MSNLQVFGDSFAHYYGPEYVTWHYYVDDICINHGLQGSGIWHSIEQLVKYVNSNEYNPDDNIIFFVTSYDRAIRYTDGKYAKRHNEIIRNTQQGDTEWDSYKKQNQSSFDYIYDNILTTDFHNTTERMLYSFLDSLPNKTLILPCFLIPDISDPKQINYSPHYTIENNCINYADSFSLFRVSMNEFESYEDGVNYIQTHSEFRKNHLSIENHKKLAILINEYFEKQDISIFNLDAFSKNIHENK